MPVKALLAKCVFRSAIGVYIGEREVFVSKVAATPAGPVEVSQLCESYTPDQLGIVLKRVLTPLLSRWKRFPLPVALGLGGQRVFFSTRPVKSNAAKLTPQTLLHEVLQSASISVDDMALDMIQAQPGKRPVASIVSCRRKYLSGLLTALRSSGVNPLRAEPGPCALLRLAAFKHRAPKKAGTVLRIFLGTEQGLAVLAVNNAPFAWRYFTLRAGDEGTSMLSAIRTLQTLSKPCGIESPVDVVMVHGRAELRELVESEQFQAGLGRPTLWRDGPVLDDAAIAQGLAIGCLADNSAGFDLARTLKPPRSLWEIFPWGETLLQGALMLCMGLFLADRSGSLERTYAAVKMNIAEHKWLESATEPELQKEKTVLVQKIEAIRKFLATRVLWTPYARDIPKRLPANATMTGFEGQCDLEISGKKKEAGLKSKKSFILRLSAPFGPDGKSPKEMDDFIQALHEHPLLKRDALIVNAPEITRYQPLPGSQATALMTIVCLPKPTVVKPTPDAEHKE